LGYLIENLAPFFLMCDSRDISVHIEPRSQLNKGSPIVVVYDMIPGGIGFSQNLYHVHNTLLGEALELSQHCTCVDGCPACVGPGGEFGISSKLETIALLRLLVE
jgi:DEAD/DEAH box helicase domain-containing protein